MRKILFLVPIVFEVFCLGAMGHEAVIPLSLPDAIAMAIQHNASIKEAEELKQAALEEVAASRADFFPKAAARYNYTRLEDKPFQRIGGIEREIGEKDAHRWDISLVQPLFKGFGIVSKYGMASNSAEIRDLEGQQIALDVSLEVKIAWFEMLLSRRMETVAEDNFAALKSHEADADGFFKQGLIALNDLLKSRVAVASAIQEREKARAGAEIALARLRTVMGVGLDSTVTPEEIDPLTCFHYDLPELMEEAIRNRPLLASLRIGIKTLENSVTLAKSAYYPEVSLTGRYEQSGDDFGARMNNYSNDHNLSVSLQASWVFFESGKTGAEVAKQKFSRQALMEKMRGIEDRIRLEIKEAFLNLSVARKNITTAEEGLKQARESWRITNLQYQQQVTTSTEVLDSRAFLSQAETNYYRAIHGYRIAEAKLRHAAGKKEI